MLYLASLRIYLLYTLRAHEIVRYAVLCVWLLSLTLVFSRFIHVGACSSTLSIYMAE